MKAFVAVTDGEWYQQLAGLGTLDEVNFWQPSAHHAFKALTPGELFLFKLHSPEEDVAGGGFFSHWTSLPVSYAWDAFGEKNGARTLLEMRQRIEQYRRVRPSLQEDYSIGCILLSQPFFLSRDDWLKAPDWQRSIVRGKSYDLTTEPGLSMWRDIQERLQAREPQVATADAPRYGEPTLVRPRLGQGSFRVLVADAYRRRCAITQGKALPVLAAAHIRPYADGGEHRIDNGLLLRSDLHTLFDRGYITVTPKLTVIVSKRLRTDFENGEEYFNWQGKPIVVPQRPGDHPRPEFLAWHNGNRFVG